VTTVGTARGGLLAPFVAGCTVGVLGGLIGLGGAEFRLPLLIGAFGFVALEAVIMNKAMSLVVVLTALPARLIAVPLGDVASHWTVIANLLIGSLVGAWLGATWAIRMRTAILYRTLAVLLVLISLVLLANEFGTVPTPDLSDGVRFILGIAAGTLIGMVAAVMGVAGGELLIPTIILLWGLDARLAGSLSVAVSLPTMLVAFARYSQDQSFAVLRRHVGFVVSMAVGSVVGTLVGGLLLGVVSTEVLVPLLAVLLLWSAYRVDQHATHSADA
jgi:uncharacterized membrane protein YfcA